MLVIQVTKVVLLGTLMVLAHSRLVTFNLPGKLADNTKRFVPLVDP